MTVLGDLASKVGGVAAVVGLPIAQGEAGEVQADGPALGAIFEQGDGLGADGGAEHALQQEAGFVGVEAQVGRAGFAELQAAAQAVEGQWGIGAGDQDEVDVGGQVLDEAGHEGVDVGGLDDVVVVEGEDEGCGAGGEAVQDGIGEAERREEGRGAEQLIDGGESAGVDLADGGDEVEQEGGQVVILLVEGEPGVGAAGGLEPVADEGGLAVAGGRGDEEQPAVGVGGELVQQARAGDEE